MRIAKVGRRLSIASEGQRIAGLTRVASSEASAPRNAAAMTQCCNGSADAVVSRMKAKALASLAGRNGGYEGLAKLVNPPIPVSRPPSSTIDLAFGSQKLQASHSVGAPAFTARRKSAAS
jgi:hypothetical protein